MTFVHLLVAVRAATAVLGCHVTTADGAKQLAQCDHMPVPLNASNSKGTIPNFHKLQAFGVYPAAVLQRNAARPVLTNAFTSFVYPRVTTDVTWKLYADGTSPLQTIDGFGAAWTDATVYVRSRAPSCNFSYTLDTICWLWARGTHRSAVPSRSC